MNKQEILDEINKTEEHLANMKKMLVECEYERWKPTKSNIYYAVTEFNNVENIQYWQDDLDKDRYNAYNCFRTKEQAKAEAEKILVRRMLEDIARRLNKGEKIDWKDKNQKKYFFAFDNKNEIFITDYCYCYIKPAIYCLHSNFTDVAIKEIGEERLKKYLRGE